MKKIITLIASISMISTSAFALSWVGNAYVSLNVSGGGELSYDLYNDGSTAQHNADPSGDQSGTAFQGTTININQGQSILLGGSIWSNDGAGSAGSAGANTATLSYAVGASAENTFGAGYTDAGLLFSNNPTGTDDRWDNNGGTAGIGAVLEIGSGLAAGTYVLSFYIGADDSDAGNAFWNYRNSGDGNGAISNDPASNNFAPYTATINVIAPALAAPEPSSFALLGLGAVLLNRTARRKKLS